MTIYTKLFTPSSGSAIVSAIFWISMRILLRCSLPQTYGPSLLCEKPLARLRQVVSSDSAMRIGCIGMTTVDTLMFTDLIPSENEDLGRLQQVYQCLGGKGMVTALTLFALGCDVSLLTLIGNKHEIEGFLPRYFDAGYLLKALVGNNRTWIPISTARSEERRVGKECRSRWSPYH